MTLTHLQQHGPLEIRDHLPAVLKSLKDGDISIQKRSLELLYVMADETNTVTIVSELCETLGTVSSVMKDDMVVKIVLLAEKHAIASPDTMLQWYIDTVVKVVLMAGSVLKAMFHTYCSPRFSCSFHCLFTSFVCDVLRRFCI